MAKEELIQFEGLVLEALPDTRFRVQLDSGLRSLGIEPAESHANFAWFDIGEDEPEIVRTLADQGILVRSGTALGRPGALRITYGTPSENDRFLRALADLR